MSLTKKLKNMQLLNVEVEDIFQSESLEKYPDIAVIGISGRFANSNNIQEFWNGLLKGTDYIQDFPEIRANDCKMLADSYGKIPNYSFFQGAYLNEIDKFDNELFSIPKKEAELMSPEQRIFLECAWTALEDAGYGGRNLSSTKTGIYVGHSYDNGGSYKEYLKLLNPSLVPASVPGNIQSIIASRLAYILNLKGPSLIVDTACSSSLVAVHLACQAIRNGECDMALAGGIKIYYNPVEKKNKANLGIASSSGKTRTFDNSSDGTGIGEGAGAIVIKRLDSAIRDRDNIYAIIKGSSINQDGSSIGITAPNSLAQEDVIVNAWRKAGIHPDTLGYFEAHGTGTRLGDPIEINGIQKAFERYTQRKQFCAIGAVKSNIGHLDCAAGIASLIKAILILKNKKIPPTLHVNQPNRMINFIESPVYIADRMIEWIDNGYPRRCGVSSFGLSGTNCHIVLEESPVTLNNDQSMDKNHSINLLTLSAKNVISLKQLIDEYHTFLSHTSVDIDDLCFTANIGRGHYNLRIGIVAQSIGDLKNKIEILKVYGLACYPEKNIFFGGTEANQSNRRAIDAINITGKCLDVNITKLICKEYSSGADINWHQFYSNAKRKKISLPSYPFMRKRFWVQKSDFIYLRKDHDINEVYPLKQKDSVVDLIKQQLDIVQKILRKQLDVLSDRIEKKN